MTEVSTFEYKLGARFNFEPPVPIRDDEPQPLTLPRLATIATLGTDFPRGIIDQDVEEALSFHFENANDEPNAIAKILNDMLDGETVLFESTDDQHTVPNYLVTVG